MKNNKNMFLQGVMKTSVKTDVDSINSVNGRCRRMTLDQTGSRKPQSGSRKPQSGRRQPVENLSLAGKLQSGWCWSVENLSLVDVDQENLSLVDGRLQWRSTSGWRFHHARFTRLITQVKTVAESYYFHWIIMLLLPVNNYSIGIVVETINAPIWTLNDRIIISLFTKVIVVVCALH